LGNGILQAGVRSAGRVLLTLIPGKTPSPSILPIRLIQRAST
jgi:hypothetical protein